MHELSIACSIAELAREEARSRQVRVTAIHVQVGALSGVVADALAGSWEMAVAGTLLESSKLVIQYVPVTVHCQECALQSAVECTFPLLCPACGRPAPEIVDGRQLQIVALEVEDSEEVEEEEAGA
jgi:hydrogenase nickel incorporation protein HypA/HybF